MSVGDRRRCLERPSIVGGGGTTGSQIRIGDGGEGGVEGGEGFSRVGDDAEGDRVVDADDARVNVNMHDLRPRGGNGIRAGRELREARAESENEVSLQQPRADTSGRT